MLFKGKGKGIDARKLSETVSLYRIAAATLDDYGQPSQGTPTLIATIAAKVTKMSEERRLNFWKETTMEGYDIVCRKQTTRPDRVVWGTKTMQVNTCEEINGRYLHIVAGYKEGRV